jgi:hypothetical protein
MLMAPGALGVRFPSKLAVLYSIARGKPRTRAIIVLLRARGIWACSADRVFSAEAEAVGRVMGVFRWQSKRKVPGIPKH